MVSSLNTQKQNLSIPRDTRRKQVKPLISIVIPTMYRPRALDRAMRSAAAQISPDYDLEIIIADNSPNASAKQNVEVFAKQISIPVKYISAPQPGIANVRNAALTLVEGQYIAFLDDDQDACPDWAAKMVTQCRADASAAVFGRIEGRTDTAVKNAPAKLAFFSRLHDGLPSGKTNKFYGCGASLLDLSKIDPELLCFDPARNQTGGEDDAFFKAIESAGGTFSWSNEAMVYEDVPPARIKKRYICKRSFAFGQGPSRICLEKDSRSLIGLARWMIIGAGQMAVYFPLALITLPFENTFHMKVLRKGCEGAGKVFWQSPFRPKFYGQAAVDKINKATA